MTTNQTRDYIVSRLRELGWEVRISKNAYERIHRYTNGADERLNKLYYKLVSIGSTQPKRQINGEVVRQAIDELKRMDDILANAPSKAGKAQYAEQDSLSIDQLAAALESRAATEREAMKIEAKARVATKPRGNGADQTEEETAEEPQSGGGLPKILVVDDSPTIRTAVTNALDKDFTFIEASDGEEAWKILQKRSDIELVITDLMMPALDGYDLIKRIRSENSPPQLHDIPIIVVTALEDTNAKLKALVNGANDFITKSTDAMELHTRVLARYKLALSVKDMAQKRSPEQSASPAQESRSTVTSIPTLKRAVTSIAKQAVKQNGANAGVSNPNQTAVKGEGDNKAHKLAALRARIKPVTDGAKPVVEKAGKLSVDAYQKLAQLSPTTAITLSATAIMAVLIAVILIINQTETPVVGKTIDVAETVPATLETDIALTHLDKPDLSQPPVSSDPVAESVATQPPLSVAAKPKSAPLPKEEIMSKAVPDAKIKTVAPPKPTKPVAVAAPKTEAVQATAPKAAESIPAATGPVTQKVEADPATVPSDAVKPDVAETTNQAPPAVEPAPIVQATAKPVATTVVPKTVSIDVNQSDLNTMMRKFVFMYEAGDVEQFVSLFTDNVRTNDRSDKAGLREDYEELFRTTNVRQMILGNVTWELDGQEAHGWGNFEVKVRKYGEEEIKSYKGSLTFYVDKNKGQVRIKRLYHGQWRT
jgi:CheY-like chemotaxis protein